MLSRGTAPAPFEKSATFSSVCSAATSAAARSSNEADVSQPAVPLSGAWSHGEVQTSVPGHVPHTPHVAL